jgi:hypothetical protein
MPKRISSSGVSSSNFSGSSRPGALGVRQVGEEAEDQQHVRPGEHPRVRGVQRQQRRHDARDPGQDQVRLAEVAALEPARPHDLADVQRRRHADQRQHAEDVRQRVVPRPVRRRLRVDDLDHRDEDRREQHDERPEDERVHQARDEPLQQLALADDDDGFGAQPLRHVAGAVDARRAAHPHEPAQQEHAAGEQRARDGDGGGERERARDHERPRTRRSSAVIAGTTSSTSPITA